MLVLLSPTIIEQTKKIVDNLLVSKVISNTILRIGKLSHNAIMACKKTFALLTSFVIIVATKANIFLRLLSVKL
jgi:hypothetical protein